MNREEGELWPIRDGRIRRNRCNVGTCRRDFRSFVCEPDDVLAQHQLTLQLAGFFCETQAFRRLPAIGQRRALRSKIPAMAGPQWRIDSLFQAPMTNALADLGLFKSADSP